MGKAVLRARQTAKLAVLFFQKNQGNVVRAKLDPLADNVVFS